MIEEIGNVRRFIYQLATQLPADDCCELVEATNNTEAHYVAYIEDFETFFTTAETPTDSATHQVAALESGYEKTSEEHLNVNHFSFLILEEDNERPEQIIWNMYHTPRWHIAYSAKHFNPVLVFGIQHTAGSSKCFQG